MDDWSEMEGCNTSLEAIIDRDERREKQAELYRMHRSQPTTKRRGQRSPLMSR